jgi:hypothetical protein
MAAAFKCALNSAKARLKRLKESEVINYTYDSELQEYELNFSPAILFIRGVNNPNPAEKSLFSKKLEISKIHVTGCQNLIPSINVTSIKLINISINDKDVDNSNNDISNIQNSARIINAEKYNDSLSAHQTEQKHKNQNENQTINLIRQNNKNTKTESSKIIYYNSNLKTLKKSTDNQNLSKFDEYKFNVALRILTLAIQLLWKGRTIFDEEFNSAFEYIRTNYLKHNNIKELHKFEQRAIKRLQLAENYCNKHKYEIAVYPRKYFDKTFANGFVSTQKWYVNDQNKRVEKTKKEQEYIDRQMLIKIHSRFKEHQNTTAFTRSSDYIKTMIPNQLDNFMLLTQQNPNQKIINQFLTTGEL